ncbi:diguanylate cyclase [Streptomyces sp. NBC_00510]
MPEQAHDLRYDLQAAIQDLHLGRSLAETLKAVSDGVVSALGFELAWVHLVSSDGDLVVASFSGDDEAAPDLTGRSGSRASWERRLCLAEAWGGVRFIPHTEGWVLDGDDVPEWFAGGPAPSSEYEWHPADRLYVPMFADGELIGIISVGKPRSSRRPGLAQCEALQAYAFQAAIAIRAARLRASMQRALVRLEQERESLRASEESFRQAFEYAPSGLAITEMGGDQHGRFARINDALCRLLGRSATAIGRYSFIDFVHPDDVGTLLLTSAEGGRAELRLSRRDGMYVWVSLRNSVVADTEDGPRYLLTHVEDIQERKLRELELAHRASHDQLTGLPNASELHTRLSDRLCQATDEPTDKPTGFQEYHRHVVAPDDDSSTQGLAVIFCALRGFKSFNARFGRNSGDAVLIEVGRRLALPLRAGDTVARLGGDEFVVLIHGVDHSGAQEIMLRLQNEIRAPYQIDGQNVRAGASFGMTWAQCGMAATDVISAARDAA